MNKVYKLDSNLNRLDETYTGDLLNTTELLNKLYPFSLILKDEETNHKFFRELMTKFELPTEAVISSSNKVNYEFVDIKPAANTRNAKEMTFKSVRNNEENQLLSIDLIKGNAGLTKADSEFVMNKYHSGQLVDIMLSHASEHDFCLIGPQGK